MITAADVVCASKTVKVRGIMLPFPDKVFPGYWYPDWRNKGDDESYPSAKLWKEPRVLIEAGEVFVPTDVLEEVLEADNSWGSGNVTLVSDSCAQWALESAELIHVETKGGVYTDAEQRKVIGAILMRVYEDES